MLLDSDNAERLYLNYQEGDSNALEELLSEASPLMEVVALSVCPGQQEDLVQEARLKLMAICIDDKYDPGRGSMYTFLSSTLKYHMIDVLRKGPKEDSEEDCDEYASTNGASIHYDLELIHSDNIIEYNFYRYPTLHSSVTEDATEYVLSTIPECVIGRSRGIIRTLCLMYNSDRQLSRVLYFATLAIARMDTLGIEWQENVDDALDLVSAGLESTLLPEVTLMLGKGQASMLQSAFAGSYVKF